MFAKNHNIISIAHKCYFAFSKQKQFGFLRHNKFFFSFSREKRIRTYQQKLFCCFLTSGLLFFFLIRKLAVVKKTQKVPILSVAYDKISSENHPCLLNIFVVSQPSCCMRFLC